MFQVTMRRGKSCATGGAGAECRIISSGTHAPSVAAERLVRIQWTPSHNSMETRMTKTRKIAAVSSLVLLLGASIWFFSSPRASHEIVIPAVHSQGAQR